MKCPRRKGNPTKTGCRGRGRGVPHMVGKKCKCGKKLKK